MIVIFEVFSCLTCQAISTQNDITNNSCNLSEDLNEGSYDAVKTLLMPYIVKEIADFYEQYLTYTPMEDPWHIKLIGFEQAGYHFMVKLKVEPYIGPHNSVGIDYITFKIDALGKVSIENFEHIKSFPIAPNYQGIIKEWPPQ